MTVETVTAYSYNGKLYHNATEAQKAMREDRASKLLAKIRKLDRGDDHLPDGLQVLRAFRSFDADAFDRFYAYVMAQ